MYLFMFQKFLQLVTMYDSLDFDYTECNSIAASTDEIIWSDDDTIVADQETLWEEGKKKNLSS